MQADNVLSEVVPHVSVFARHVHEYTTIATTVYNTSLRIPVHYCVSVHGTVYVLQIMCITVHHYVVHCCTCNAMCIAVHATLLAWLYLTQTLTR